MTRSTWFILVGLLLGACGEDEGPNLSKYSEQCMRTEDCEEPLACSNGICTIPCGDTPTCAEADSSGDSVCLGGFCFIACSSSIDCPADLQCVMQASPTGTCRP